MSRIGLRTATPLLFVLGAPSAFAHHSSAVHYDFDRPVVHENVTVLEWRFINPHARLVFEAPNADGEVVQWTAQTTNVNRMKRLGFTKDSFKPGEVVTLSGDPSRDGRPDMYMRQLVRRDGTVVNFTGSDLPLPDDPAFAPKTDYADNRDFSGVWENIPGPVPPEIIDALAPDDAVFWVSPDQGPEAGEEVRGEIRDLPLTEKALAFLEGWTPGYDECRPPSGWLVMSAPFLHQFEKTEGDRIHIRHEYLDVERTIWLDGRGRPSLDRVPRTLAGHSVGHWEGDTLVVETTHMVDGPMTRNGVYHSENAVLTEWISRDGDTMTILRVMDDPEHFTQPVASILLKRRLTGEAYASVPTYGECVLQQQDAR